MVRLVGVLYQPAFPAVLGFIALLLISVPTWVLFHALRTRRGGIPGVATVVEKEEHPFRGNFHCWVQFAGRRCRIVVQRKSWRNIRTGESIDIRYDPDKPGVIRHGNAKGVWPKILLCSTLIALGIAGGVGAGLLWYRMA